MLTTHILFLISRSKVLFEFLLFNLTCRCLKLLLLSSLFTCVHSSRFLFDLLVTASTDFSKNPVFLVLADIQVSEADTAHTELGGEEKEDVDLFPSFEWSARKLVEPKFLLDHELSKFESAVRCTEDAEGVEVWKDSEFEAILSFVMVDE